MEGTPEFAIPFQSDSKYSTIFYYSLLFFTILYYSILYYSILLYTILYYSILFYTILYYSILFYTIPYYSTASNLLKSKPSQRAWPIGHRMSHIERLWFQAGTSKMSPISLLKQSGVHTWRCGCPWAPDARFDKPVMKILLQLYPSSWRPALPHNMVRIMLS